MQPNGAWQLPDLFRGKYPEPPVGEDFLAIDTETTGLNPYKPLPGFKYPACPFFVSWCEALFDKRQRVSLVTGCIQGTVEPSTRKVTWKKSELDKFRKVKRRHKLFVIHNSLFDLKMLEAIGLGFSLEEIRDRVHDSMGAAHVLDSLELHGLKPLCIKYLDMLDDDQDILHEKTVKAHARAASLDPPIPTAEVGADTWLPGYLDPHDKSLEVYGVKDSLRCAKLWIMQVAALVSEGLWHNYVRERKIVWATHRMQSHPVHLSPTIDKTYAGYKSRKESASQEVVNLSGDEDFNLNSHPQLSRLLFETYSFPVLSKTAKGKPSTDKDTLNHLYVWAASNGATDETALIDAIMEYRKTNTACLYLEKYYEFGIRLAGSRDLWLRSNFNPWGSDAKGLRTTRFSSSDPPLHNVGKPDEDAEVCIREVFTPPPGRIWYSFDFDQLELRIMARLSGDQTLIRILSEGLDQHWLTTDAINLIRCGPSYWKVITDPKKYQAPGVPDKVALTRSRAHAEVLSDWKAQADREKLYMGNLNPIARKQGKAINFMWQYGGGKRRLAFMAGIHPDEFDASMRSAYPGVVTYMDHASALASAQGFIETLFGYRLYVDHRAPYKATNYADQGTAGDLLKNSMIAVQEYLDEHDLNDTVYPLMCIHDELILEASRRAPKKHLRAIKDLMSVAGDPIGCPTPSDCKIIKAHWGDTEEIAL